jgi:hypothetical protein
MRGRAATVLGLCGALVGCGGTSVRLVAGEPTPGTRHRADGIAFVVPEGWQVANGSQTPGLANPSEVFTLGTGPWPSRAGRCNHLPSAALEAMGPDDVLLTLQERVGSPQSFPPRPARFTLPPPRRMDADLCAGPHPAFTSRWFEFADNGRAFHVLVAVGRSATRERTDQATAVLDSLEIEPREPVRMDPDGAIPVEDGERGLAFAYPSPWQLHYEGPLTSAVPARLQVALGTFRLRQSVPDPGCAPATALEARVPGDGFLFLAEDEGLSREQLAAVPRRPVRLRLPRASHHRHRCFGMSWYVRFRDQDRAFQAFVYGPRARRRQALAILDSLRVTPPPFAPKLRAARFPETGPWRTRVSGPSPDPGTCLRQRVSWASTVPFTDGTRTMPPTSMIEALPPEGIILAAVQFFDRCRASLQPETLRPPLRLRRDQVSDFPGPRGLELPLYRVAGRFPGRYEVDVWAFFGRNPPTGGQWAQAQRELRGVRWPAWLEGPL